ncbi:hypothetical protein DFH09DRAFT_1435721 [Mycena vulgaris]|nr:hypothetical protein DFH09DRAFT_1435721 [Mycena vulgaris]
MANPVTPNPSSSNPPASAMPSTADLLAAQSQQIDRLQEMVDALLNLGPQQAPPPVAPAVVQPQLPPFTAVTPPQSKSSLYALFPTIEAGMLLEIARHELKPVDLFKLDSRFRDKFDVERTEDSKTRTGTARDYPSLHSLLIPLMTYFRVLQAFAALAGDTASTRIIGDGAGWYTAHLLKLHQRYEWREMADGDYSGWGHTDADLMNQYLYDRRRPPPRDNSQRLSSSPKSKSTKSVGEQVCFAYNKVSQKSDLDYKGLGRVIDL